MNSSVKKFTPTEARDPDNLIFVKINLELHNKQNRRYPEINVGNKLKIYTQKNHLIKKINQFGYPAIITLKR